MLLSEDMHINPPQNVPRDTVQQDETPESSHFEMENCAAVSEVDPSGDKACPELVNRAMHNLLRLNQVEKDLNSYFNDFRDLIKLLPADDEILAICSRRFINGLAEQQQKVFVREWLKIGGNSMQNIEDCLTLLDRCLKRIKLPVSAINTSETYEVGMQRCEKFQNSRASDIEGSLAPELHQQEKSVDEKSSKRNLSVADEARTKVVPRKRMRYETPNLISTPNVITRAAWAARNRSQEVDIADVNTIEKSREHCSIEEAEEKKGGRKLRSSDKGSIEDSHVKVMQGECLDMKLAKVKGAKAGSISKTRNSIPSHRRRSQRISTPQTPTKNPKAQTTLRIERRKMMNRHNVTQAEQLAQSSTTTDRYATPSTIRSSLRLSQALVDKAPTLVPVKERGMVVIPETSDDVRLPLNSRLVQNEQSKKKRNIKYHVTAAIPSLTLTTSDLAT